VARNVAWGIDIGESAVKAVKLRKVGDSVVIQDYRTVPCETRPEEAQGGDKDYRIRNALATLQREVKLAGSLLAVSMPGRDVFPKFISLPPVDRKRIPELVRYEARTQMPFPIDEVIWDYQPLTDEIVPGEEVEVALFAIKRASVYSFLTNLRLGGLLPDIVEVSPLALYNFLMYDRSIETGTVMIDIGAGNTDLVILDGERFWTRNVSISGNDITRALQEKYQISFEEAENLKRKAATSKQADRLFGVMRPILDDLIGEVQRSIGYYKAQSRNVRIEHVVLLGNAFKLKGLIDYFRKNLDYEVSLLDSLRRVKLGAESDTRKFEAELLNYAAAIGLGLQGLGLGRVSIDLMPREVVRERILRRKIPWAAAAVALLAIPVLLGFSAVRRDEKTVLDEKPQLEQEVKRLEDNERRVRDLGNNDGVLKQLAGFLTLGGKRLQWLKIVDGLNKAFNLIQRDRFLVRSVREVVEGEAGRRGRPGGPGMGEGSPTMPTPEMMTEGMMGEGPGAAPPPPMPSDQPEGEEEGEEKPKGIVVEIQFEKQRAPTVGETADGPYLQKRLQQQDGVVEVVIRSVAQDGDPRPQRRTTMSGAPAIEDSGAKRYIYTVWVTFGEKKPEPKEKAPEGEAAGQ